MAELEAVLFDSAPNAMLYFDGNLRLQRVNRRAMALWLLPESQLLGSHITEVRLAGVDEAALQQTAATGIAVQRAAEQGDSGQVARYLDVTYTPVFDGEGRGVLVTATDITHQRELERELRDRRSELIAVLDNMVEGVTLMHPDGTIRYLKSQRDDGQHLDSYETSIQLSQLLPLAMFDASGQEIPEHQFPIVRAARGERFSEMEVYYYEPDGRLHIAGISGSSVRDDEGQVRMAITVSRNITRERSLEQELKTSRDELRAVLDNMTEGVLIVEADGRVRYRNEAELRIMGLTESEQPATAIPDADLAMRYLDGTPVPAAELPVGRVLRGERFTLSEYLITNLAGEDLVISTDGTPVRDERGKITAAVVVNRDLTRQYETEQEVRRWLYEAEREHQRLLSVIEQMPDGVIITSAPDNRLVVMNRVAAEIYGLDADLLPRSEDAYLSHYQTITPEGEELAVEARPLARALAGEVVKGVRLQVSRADGSRAELLVSAAPIIAASGQGEQITGAVSVFQDISELMELDRLKDEFISITSHELRTPLTAIKGYSQMIARKLKRMDELVRSELEKPLASILERTARMIEMTSDLLDVSRITTGGLEVQGVALALSALMMKLVEAARLIYRRDIELILPAAPVVVTGDERLLEQVLNNLLVNAVKYSPEDKPIVVKLVQNADSAQVSVIDQGIGISAAQQPRLFERFYRSEQGKRSAAGLGLGLYIAAGIVKAHRGHIWAESAGEGKGATFSFTLPLAAEAE